MERIKFKPDALGGVRRNRGVFISFPDKKNVINVSMQLVDLLDLKDQDLLEFEVLGDEVYIRKTTSKEDGHPISIVSSPSRNGNVTARTGYNNLARSLSNALRLPDGPQRLTYTGRINSGFYIFSK